MNKKGTYNNGFIIPIRGSRSYRGIAHSLKVRLFNLSDHDNRRYQQLLVRYMQERFLYRLSESKYCNNFILKGGALLYAFDEFLPRPTLDVDFMGIHISNDKEAIIAAFKEIASQNIAIELSLSRKLFSLRYL